MAWSVTNENEKHGEIQKKNAFVCVCMCILAIQKWPYGREASRNVHTHTHTCTHTPIHTHTQKLLEASLFLSHFPLNFTMLLILIRVADAPQKLP